MYSSESTFHRKHLFYTNSQHYVHVYRTICLLILNVIGLSVLRMKSVVSALRISGRTIGQGKAIKPSIQRTQSSSK